MASWFTAWGLNGMLVVGLLYLFAFAGNKNKRLLNIFFIIFMVMAMIGTCPIDEYTCR